MIKAVLFDVDGVLLDSFEANFLFFKKLFEKFNHPLPTREQYRDVFHLTLRNAIKSLTTISDEQEVDRIWSAGRNRQVEYDTSIVTMPDDSEEIIKRLGNTYLLAIVTGRVRESVFEVSRLATLEKYFTVVVACQDTEKHKPHPEPLLLACQKLGVLPSECVYIGDALTDLQSARSAGMKAILYSKTDLGGADGVTFCFRELPELIKSLDEV
jgi:HAD superfamily hydrolase (TIGR01549 family)